MGTAMGAKKAAKGMVAKAVETNLQDRIFTIRGERVILDSDLAEIYGEETKILNKAVARNIKRFPAELAFRLTQQEAELIQVSRSQNATLKQGANIKYLPRVSPSFCLSLRSPSINERSIVRS